MTIIQIEKESAEVRKKFDLNLQNLKKLEANSDHYNLFILFYYMFIICLLYIYFIIMSKLNVQ